MLKKGAYVERRVQMQGEGVNVPEGVYLCVRVPMYA